MKHIRITNWVEYQQYKDRDPKWIKLHRSLLDNYDYTHLTDNQKSHLIGLWLLAAKLDNKIPADPKWIADRIAATSKIDLKPLFEAEFIELYDAVQDCTEPYESVPREEESRVEEEKIYCDFDKVLTAWNNLVVNTTLPKMQTMTDKRKQKYRTRCQALGGEGNFWSVLEVEIPLVNKFVRDNTFMDFDYLVRSEDTFNKLAEGGWREKKKVRREQCT